MQKQLTQCSVIEEGSTISHKILIYGEFNLVAQLALPSPTCKLLGFNIMVLSHSCQSIKNTDQLLCMIYFLSGCVDINAKYNVI